MLNNNNRWFLDNMYHIILRKGDRCKQRIIIIINQFLFIWILRMWWHTQRNNTKSNPEYLLFSNNSNNTKSISYNSIADNKVIILSSFKYTLVDNSIISIWWVMHSKLNKDQIIMSHREALSMMSITKKGGEVHSNNLMLQILIIWKLKTLTTYTPSI